MFQKEKLSEILEKIRTKYESIQDFANHAEIDRGYLSRQINMKLDNPPTPKILKRIADNSKGMTDYLKLMYVCGYLSPEEQYNYEEALLLDKLEDIKFTEKSFDAFINYSKNKLLDQKVDIEDYYLSNEDKQNVLQAYKVVYNEYNEKINEFLNDNPNVDKEKKGTIIMGEESYELKNYKLDALFRIINYLSDIKKMKSSLCEKKFTNIPVLGKIPAGIPMEMVEDIGEFESISTDKLRGGKQYFALKIDEGNGHSMEPEYRPGDILICLKCDTCENGDDCVVAVNGDDATFKRVFKNEKGITLQPLNTMYPPVFYSNEEIINKPIKILGIVVEIRRTKKK